MRIHRFYLCVAALSATSLLASVAGAQHPLLCRSHTDLCPTRSSHSSFLETLPPEPRNYTSHYLRHLQNYHRPPTRISDYIFDKYFLMNPNLSPYLNLTRHNIYGNNYYQRVLPERRRREMAKTRQPTVVFVVSKPINVVASPVHIPLPIPSETGVSAVESYNNARRDLKKSPRTRQFNDPSFLGTSVRGQRYH